MNFFRKAQLYFKKEKFEIFREIIISILFSVLISGFVTAKITSYFESRKTQRQFTYDFGRTFFDNQKYRNISIALEDEYLYGKIDKEATLSEYDLDDYLGLLSDMQSYYEDGFISKELVSDQYGYYICITYQSKFVRSYREKLKQEGFSDSESYSFLDYLVDDLNIKGKDCKKL